ncbi:MAG: type II toxin-antitoxin system Phd/YefM family antitoxin [Elusimicrobia bacterium]|nr:type II toxin-antitoxin system Phd/YefM family antitoxin [Elusimicrobiota bacterium]
MKIVRHPAAFAAVSELRTRMDQIIAQLRETPVNLEKHGRPVAVLVEPGRFSAMQDALEATADILLAFEANRGKGKRLQELEKRLKTIEKGTAAVLKGRTVLRT